LSPHSPRSSSTSPRPNRDTFLIWQLVVHEILGHLASAEGVVKALRELRTRAGLLVPNCQFVPRAARTMVGESD
jgi:hypothetical protein